MDTAGVSNVDFATLNAVVAPAIGWAAINSMLVV